MVSARHFNSGEGITAEQKTSLAPSIAILSYNLAAIIDSIGNGPLWPMDTRHIKSGEDTAAEQKTTAIGAGALGSL